MFNIFEENFDPDEHDFHKMINEFLGFENEIFGQSVEHKYI